MRTGFQCEQDLLQLWPKFETTFYSVTSAGATRSTATAVPILYSWSCVGSNFHVDSEFRCCSMNFCTSLLLRHNELYRNSKKIVVVLPTKGLIKNLLLSWMVKRKPKQSKD